MRYALLIYRSAEHGDDAPEEIDPGVAAVLARPGVVGWVRLHGSGSATTVAGGSGRVLVTDGPFLDSKEVLAGVIFVEAEHLDAALAVAEELQALRPLGAIEVRPAREVTFRGA